MAGRDGEGVEAIDVAFTTASVAWGIRYNRSQMTEMARAAVHYWTKLASFELRLGVRFHREIDECDRREVGRRELGEGRR
jgi:hypothetical protein